MILLYNILLKAWRLTAPCDETIRVRQANVLASKSEMWTGEVVKDPWSVSCTVAIDALEVWLTKAKCLANR